MRLSRKEKVKKLEESLKKIREELGLSLNETISLTESVFRKWKKEEDYHNSVVDYIYQIVLNYYRKNGKHIHTQKVLYLLKEFKNVNTNVDKLRVYYIKLIKKIKYRVSTQVYREKLRTQESIDNFFSLLKEYNQEGFISLRACNLICNFFLERSCDGLVNTGKSFSYKDILAHALGEAKRTFPDKSWLPEVFLNSFFMNVEVIEDKDLESFFSFFRKQ